MLEQTTKKLQILGQVLNLVLQKKTVRVVESPTVIVPDDGYAGLSSVTIESVPFEIQLQDKEITPTRAAQVITADANYDGLNSVVVLGDRNLIAENIKYGVQIFGITGKVVDASQEVALQVKTVAPTGRNMCILPDETYYGLQYVIIEGDDNLTPENIAAGVTIYGVTGELRAGAGMKIPSQYQEYFEQALTIFTDDYANVAISEGTNDVSVLFMMDDFSVLTYDKSTTEYTALGFFTCSYMKDSGTWATADHRVEATISDGRRVSTVKYSSEFWTFEGETIWPTAGGSSSGGGSGGGTSTASLCPGIVWVTAFQDKPSDETATLTTTDIGETMKLNSTVPKIIMVESYSEVTD